VTLPASTKFAIIGAGIHGLSTALHLAQMLKSSGRGSGEDILVIDKTAIAAGASGIACGVVRNNYFQPAMRELMAHSVEVWESDPKAYDLRAAEGDRLRIGVRRRRGGVDPLHERAIRRLAGARHHLGSA
jgi:glycine/D-amino acid oxidase-like deaminating enzyme